MVPGTIWSTAAQAIAHASQTASAPLVWDPNAHLLNRFAFGARPGDRDQLARTGPDAWWAAQVALGRAKPVYDAAPTVKAASPLLLLSTADVTAICKNPARGYYYQACDQLSAMTLGMQMYSPAQLYETLVDFFSNHLNVPNHTADTPWTRHTMDRDVIRPNALGNYTDMLLASARNPAMLQYLSQAQSSKIAINANYGREILEMHSVGLRANYTETDVTNSALLLTGRSIDKSGKYVYLPNVHWTGPVKILDFTHANPTAAGGETAADAYIRYLATHPQTAYRLAEKLCIRFISDTPSAALVQKVADVYLANQTAIEPTVRAIFTSEDFWAARGQKLRRPAEKLVAAVRLLGLTPNTKKPNLAATLNGMHWQTAAAGHSPLDWKTPTGYPDVATSWRSSGALLASWGWHKTLASNGWPEHFDTFDVTSLYSYASPVTSGAAIDAMAIRLFGQALKATDRATLLTFLGEAANTSLKTSALRWYAPHVLALMLNSPYQALR